MTDTQTKSPEAKPPEKKVQSLWTDEEKDNRKSLYGCDILIENGSLDDVNTKNAPSDALIVKYVHDDSIRYDLTRGPKVKMFDMYWDKMKGDLKNINFGNGNIKPNLWGYQAPKSKKKRK
tara:strand:- start:38 stop:397 length:360 start_codon:yes stop_codon:yes gene_type:complete